MAREVMRFFGQGDDCWRVVDQYPAADTDSARGLVERYDGRDALGNERWRRVDPQPSRDPAVSALLTALATATVTIPVSSEPISQGAR